VSGVVSAKSRVFALLGDPVSHSLSPRIHNAAMQALGCDGIYAALRCSAVDCAALLPALARAGGGGNVTIPHKRVAADAVESRTEAVIRTHACNTFWFERGLLCGDNTDVAGFRGALQHAFGSIANARVLLLGAGGAARAVLAGLLEEGVDSIDVITRTTSRIAELIALTGNQRTRVGAAHESSAQQADLVINATPLGLHSDDPAPFPLELLRDDSRVFDLVYRQGGTQWVLDAQRRGLQAADGTEMLVRQAGAAFEHWWHLDAPLDVMREALRVGS
jgi:shikimate dehydrogenase